MGEHPSPPAGKRSRARWLLAALAALCLLLVALVYLRPGMWLYASAAYSFLPMQPESVEECPGDNGETARCYTFTVPDGAIMRRGLRFSVYLQHCYVKVWLDGELQYSSWEEESPHIGHTPGNYWVTPPLRSDYAGKTLRVEITPVYGEGWTVSPSWLVLVPEAARPGEPQFLLIDHGQLLTRLTLPADLPVLVVGMFILIAGLFVGLFGLGAKLERGDRDRLFYLGALGFTAALWNLSQLPSLLLALDVYGLHKALWYMGACAYLLLPLLMLLFLGCLHGGKVNRAAFGVCLGSAALILLLQFLGVCDLYETMFWHGLLSVVLLLASVFAARPRGREILWLLPFPLALALDLILIRAAGSARFAAASLVWVALNLCIRGAGFVSEAFSRERQLRRQEKDLYELRLRALSQQIRPHFIYNTLSSIYALCKNGSPRTLPVIEDFLAYLQANYTAISQEKPIPFAEELRHIKAYLGVEAVRYDGLLEVEYDTPHTEFRLPPLTLQPVVENAVKHGMSREHALLRITVRTGRTEEGSQVVIEDNGPGFDPEEALRASEESAEGTQEACIGLPNVRGRLELISGGSLAITPRPGGGTVVTIRIPDSPPRREPPQ